MRWIWTCVFVACLCYRATGNQAFAFDPIQQEYERLQQQIQTRDLNDPIYRKAQQRLERETLRREALIWDSDRDPVDVVVRRTRALLEDLRQHNANGMLTTYSQALDALQQTLRKIPASEEAQRRELFDWACRLRRRIAFANPLLDFDRIVFLKHHRARYNHMVDQYFGFHAVPGGGVYVLEDAFSESPKLRNILADTTVQKGRLKGRKLEGGSFISLDLSYHADSILFAWTEADPVVEKWTDYVPHEVLWQPSSTYHIFKADSDGCHLVQLTDGKWNDFDPVFLPNGRIAFLSERRGGYLRCGLRPDPTYTLHSMRADGSDIICLSYHETHEWHPSVNNDGMIVYTRWDYVDRDSDIAHHLWLTYPDGRDPRSLHGNYPIERESRPWMEMSIRAIPKSTRYVTVSAPHHGQAYGSLVLVDQTLPDDAAMSQLKRLTPEAHLPESESAPGVAHAPHKGKHKPRGEVYGTPWPLSEDYYLCVYDPDGKNYGIYLLDSFGNRELIYRDPEIACLDPIPLRTRPKPPVIPAQTCQAIEDQTPGCDKRATIAVMNVYDSDFPWPEGTQIKALRIVQLFPKTTPAASAPNIGVGNQSLSRGVLGTVPVEADGSVYFEAPAGVPLYFQALDERGLAVQTMRSDTYVHAGEKMTCAGCHEPKHQGIKLPTNRRPLALQRPPRQIEPEFTEAYPLTFARLVQPVLERNCVTCHAQEEEAPDFSAQTRAKWGWSEAYHSLSNFAWAKHGGNGSLQRNGSSRSIAGDVGAQASKLFRMLDQGHHDVKLDPEDLRRITLWLDCNSNFYGVYHDLEKQARGEVVMPILQ